MKIGLVGVGQAGGKITQAIVEYGHHTDAEFVTAAIAVNTAKADLLGLDWLPMEDRLLIGQSRSRGTGPAPITSSGRRSLRKTSAN